MHFVNKTKISIFVLLLFFFLPSILVSHPHVFISSNIKVVFDANGFQGFKVHWSFDEFFSAMIANDYDQNRNGIFDKKEVQLIYKGAFSNLKNFNYFTTIRVKEIPYKINGTKNFNATLIKGKMSYYFFIPVQGNSIKEIVFSQYDATYYTDIAMASKVTNKSSKFRIESTLYENKNKSFYNGMVHPREIKIKIRQKK